MPIGIVITFNKVSIRKQPECPCASFRKAHASDQGPQPRNVIYGPGLVLPPGAKYPMPPPPPSGRIAGKYDENEYAMIWELQSSGNDSGKGDD